MADGFEAGRAYVRISPDMDGFSEELRSGVDEATSGAKNKVTVPLGVDDAKLKAGVDDAKVKVDSLGKRTAKPKLDLDLGPFNVGKARVSVLLKELGSKGVRVRLGLNDSDLKKKAAEDEASISKLKVGLIGLAGVAGGALVPALGGAAAGFGAIAGVGALAFGPIVSAFTNAAGDATKLNQAIAKMPPGARSFTTELLKAKSQLSGLESIAQNAVLPGAGVLLQGVMSMLPQVKAAVGQMGQVLGSGLASVGKTLQSSGAKDIFQGLIANGVQLMKTVGPALGQLVGAIAKIGAQKGAVAGLGQALTGIAGGLTALIRGLGPALGSLGSVLGSLGGVVGALGGPLAQVVAALAGALAPALQALLPAVRVLASALGAGIAAAVRGLTPLLVLAARALAQVVTAVSPLLPPLGQLTGMIGTELTGALRPLLPVLAQVTGQLGQALSPVIRALSPALTALLAPLGQIVTALSPLLLLAGKLTAALLGLAARAITPVAQLLGGVLSVAVRAAAAVISTSFHSIGAVASWLYSSAVRPEFTAMSALFRATGTVASWLYNTAIRPAFTAIGTVAKAMFSAMVKPELIAMEVLLGAVGAAGMALWHSAIQPAFNGIGSVASWLYRSAVKPQIEAIETLFRAVGSVGSWLYSSAISPAFHSIGSVASWLYSNGIRPQINAIETLFRQLASLGTWLQSGLTSSFHGIASMASWLYNTGIRPQVNAIESVFRAMESAVSRVWSGMLSGARSFVAAFRSAFNAVEGAVKTPTNYLIQHVYDNGIAKFWNTIQSKIGVGSKLPAIAGLATGGVLPGYAPGHDTIPAMLSPGESVLTPGATRALGVANINALNAAHQPGKVAPAPRDGVARYAGGVAGAVEGAVGSAVSDVTGAVKGAVSGAESVASITSALLTGNTTALNNALSKFVGTDASGALGTMMTGIPKKIVSGLVDLAKSAGSAGGGNTAPVHVSGNVASWISQGMKIAGVSGAAWTNGLEQMAMSESGGNPSIVNHWDSNAKAGTPSAGLLQFIYPTFRQYAKPGYEQWMNPVHQVVADSWERGYIRSRYGSIGNVPGIKSIAHGGGYVGYDSGGYLPPGVTNVVNASGTPEPVFTGQQWQTLQKAVNNGQSGGPSAPVVNVYFTGTQLPNAEQTAELKRQLGLAVGGA